MKNGVRIISQTMREVFSSFVYVTIAVLFGFFIFSLSLWLRNLKLLADVIASSLFSVSDKILFFVKFLGGIATAVTPFSAVLIVTMSILFGINISLLVYYLNRAKRIPAKEGIGATGGIVSGMFGIGCASCGSFLLGSILASFGASGVIALLPLKGEELSILSIVLLSLSIYWMSKSIQSQKICRIQSL